MNAGLLTERITLQAATLAADAAGQEIQTWANVGTVWANVRYLTGREYIAASADTAATSASFRVRYRTDVLPGWRISYAGRTWNISEVLPDATRRQFVDLPATSLD